MAFNTKSIFLISEFDFKKSLCKIESFWKLFYNETTRRTNPFYKISFDSNVKNSVANFILF